MPNDLTPDERRRLHQTAERLAVQLRREALQEFPGAAMRWWVRVPIPAVAAAFGRVFKGLRYRIHPSPPRS
ncbi:hypothetical protein LJR129_004500 [Acidovorax sp. LjRoot129]|uniref:hypothetical protein n=1 Tax=Acidovorax sp. LjRoot129 TaxID=3342260 RepID=UPI003ECE164F